MVTDAELDKWNEIVHDLQGTCNTLAQALVDAESEHLEDHMPFLEYLDNEIFCCESCSWWCEISESSMNTPESCRDCVPDDEDDEE